MKNIYSVMYDSKKTRARECDEFKTKLAAFKHAIKMSDQHGTKIFVDEINEEGDTINYYHISKNNDLD